MQKFLFSYVNKNKNKWDSIKSHTDNIKKKIINRIKNIKHKT